MVYRTGRYLAGAGGAAAATCPGRRRSGREPERPSDRLATRWRWACVPLSTGRPGSLRSFHRRVPPSAAPWNHPPGWTWPAIYFAVPVARVRPAVARPARGGL